MRLNVALDSAKGILYLHTEANPPIFHRDIKTRKILIDSNLTAKVADFGLSRLTPLLDDYGVGPNYVSTVVRGTPDKSLLEDVAKWVGLKINIHKSQVLGVGIPCSIVMQAMPSIELDKEVLVADKMKVVVGHSFRRPMRAGSKHQQMVDLNSLLESVSISQSHDRWFCDLTGDGEFGSKRICRWWELDWQGLMSFSDWHSWFSSIRLSSKVNNMLEGVFCVAWWSIWGLRNHTIFNETPPRRSVTFDDIVSYSFIWCSSRYDIPFEIQMEIMKKVYDVKSLIQFRSVSKPQKSFIDSSEFIKGYGARHTQPQSFILSYMSDLENKAKHYRLVDDDNNESFKENHLVLLSLSDPILTLYGFGVCPFTSDPTVVKFICADNMPWHVEVFTLSSGVWNLIPSGNLPRQSIRLNWSTQVVKDRFIYWGAREETFIDNGESTTNHMLVSFDLITKEFKVVDLSLCLLNELNGGYVSVSKLRESLVLYGCVYVDGGECCNVWVMEHDSSFRKLFKIRAPLHKILGFRKNGEPIFELEEADEQFTKLNVYEPHSQQIKQIKNLGIFGAGNSFFMGSYKESLPLLDHLDLHIYSDDSLNIIRFQMRLHVVLDSAKGILCLHTEANPPIFKRSNILGDSKLTSKVADFGLLRLAPLLDDYRVVLTPNYASTVRGSPYKSCGCTERLVLPQIRRNEPSKKLFSIDLDFRNNSFSHVKGDLNPPVNASIRLNGNPICRNSSLQKKNKKIVDPSLNHVHLNHVSQTGYMGKKWKYKQTSSIKSLLTKLSITIDNVKSFSFQEMALATQNFSSSSVVGRGGYGKVYKGISWDGTVVAIKRAEEGSLQGEKEFLTEIELLSRLHHRNLVSLVGYCDEEKEQMLVYEFISRGTLRDWLNAKSGESLSFRMRLNVALDSAKGILYLHTEANPPIFHRDIKTSNILIDSKLTAKVADFGLSRLAPLLDDYGVGPNYVSTVVRGTPGYLDPEYLLTHKLTDKKILTSMKPISHGKNIVREVKLANQAGIMFSIIDNRMGSYPSECLEKFVSLALWCCNDKPEKRPSMLDVVRELEHILEKMPETGPDFSEPESRSFVESSSTSSVYSSSNVQRSDLSSGGNPIVEAVGNSDGILCVGEANVFKNDYATISDNFVAIYGTWLSSNSKILFVAVYAPHQASCKRVLWEHVSTLIGRWNGETIILGDFNEVCSIDERRGSCFNPSSARVFDHFISSSGLVDVKLEGYVFTWSHPSGSKMSKLDRFLVSEGVFSIFPSITALCLDCHLLDHRPIILREVYSDFGPIPFRFYHLWFSLEGFDAMVEQTWRSFSHSDVNRMIRFKKKLQDLKAIIRCWVKDKRMHRRLELQIKLHDINQMEAKDSFQKSKIKWAIEGDKNSKFFHGIINKKRSQLEIRGVFDNGLWCTDPGKVKEAFFNHFEARFKKPVAHRFMLNFPFNKRLSDMQAADLERNVSRDEIRFAVWNCGENKSPGPDGYTFEFFRKYWNIVGPDFCEAVEYFFETGLFSKGCNSSFVALILKVADAKFINDFRPISLIGSVYKVVTKILANRLALVIADLVSDTKFAFVAKRQILDGPFILNEILHWCKRKKKQAMFFKVDFAKAYDSVLWDYLLDVLEAFGFGQTWCKWIRVDEGLFKGVQLQGSISIFYLFYVDDAMFIGEWYLHLQLKVSCIKQLAIKRWDEYGFVIRPGLVGVTCKSARIDL
uniref:Probable LRR receptor-like serine/threonine-protein kinase At1g06840 isoform X2 n=1 Tax=Tanacetum cinerariifolium TaxID=118510 RepID=A0A6L2M050_TANCI|nr:probable LRR receptor-like serine/threonine-protein kinase At1g06840 isoform X2 [Tanacetum cinerariifolium]